MIMYLRDTNQLRRIEPKQPVILKPMWLILGDWCEDYHNRFEQVLIKTNKNCLVMRNAYKESCKRFKITFSVHDANAEYDGVDHSIATNQVSDKDDIDFSISPYIQDILLKSEFPLLREYQDWYEGENEDLNIRAWFVELLMWFIQQSLPDLEWDFTEDTIPIFNGDEEFPDVIGLEIV